MQRLMTDLAPIRVEQLSFGAVGAFSILTASRKYLRSLDLHHRVLVEVGLTVGGGG